MVHRSKWLVWVGLMMACALSWSVQAGDPGPYRLAFVDISAAPYQDGQRLAIELRNMESLPVAQKEFCFLCSSMTESSDSVEMIYVYTLPVGLDIDELRLAVAGDKAAAKRMQTVIHRFADAEGSGIDGLLIYLHQAGKVSVYTMDRNVGSKLSEESKPVKNRLLHSSLDTLLENAARKIARPL